MRGRMNNQEAYLACRAFAGQFQTFKQGSPKNTGLRNQPLDKVILHTCIDDRLDDTHALRWNDVRNIYHPAVPAAAVHPFEFGSATNAGFSTPFELNQNIKSIIVMGHTDCGAIKRLYAALTQDASTALLPSQAAMMRMVPQGLAEKVRQAAQAGVEPALIQAAMEQIIVLQSVRNLYDYQLGDKSTRERIDSGDLHIYAAMRDVITNKISVFDNEHQTFRDLDEIRKQAGNPNCAELSPYTAASTARRFIVQQGASSETVAEGRIAQLDRGIQEHLKLFDMMIEQRRF